MADAPAEPESDASVLARWAEGDAGAGGELVDRYFEAIARFFRNKLAGSIDVQDDLVQATFTACAEAGTRYRGEGSVRSFLFSIAYNVLRRHYETQRRHERVDFGTVSVHDLAKGAATLLGARAELAMLADALRRLPVELQTAVELHYWEGATVAEIGLVLQWPEGTVKTRLRRARKLLRDELAAAEAEPAVREAALSALPEVAADEKK